MKPYGFHKKGNRFFEISEDGFINLVGLEKSRLNCFDESAFQIYCGFAIYDPAIARSKPCKWYMYTTLYAGNKGINKNLCWDAGNYYCVCEKEVKDPIFRTAIKDTTANIKKMVLEVIEADVVPIISEVNTSKAYFNSEHSNFRFMDLDYLYKLFGRDILPYLQEEIERCSDPIAGHNKYFRYLKEVYRKISDKYSIFTGDN